MHLTLVFSTVHGAKKKLKPPEKKDNPDVRYSDIFEKWLETRTIIIC